MTLSFADHGRPSIYTYVSKLKQAGRELRKQSPQQRQRQDENQSGTISCQRDCIYSSPVMKDHLRHTTLLPEKRTFGNHFSLQPTQQAEQDDDEDSDSDDLEYDDLDSDDTDSEDMDSGEMDSGDLKHHISYLSAWKKLNGLETKVYRKIAISINLSPIFLAAANVARQRRQYSR